MTAKKPAKKGLGVVEGDVYAGPVLDGRFGAVRVIKVTKNGQGRGRDSMTLVCTQYIGAAVPTIEDPALRKVLRRKRFEFGNRPAVMLTTRPPPADFVHIGTFAPTRQERAIDPMGTYGSDWHIIQDVLLEWRWEHQREAFEAEVSAARAEAEAEAAAAAAKAKAAPARRTRTPRSKLTETDFWALIGRLDGDDVAGLVKALARRSQADIREFQELLAHKLYLLDGRRFAAHAGAAGNSDDAFLYARCAVVARGRAFYKDVLVHPDRFPADADFEDLLAVAADAYRLRTDDDLDENTHYSYETGANAAGWQE